MYNFPSTPIRTACVIGCGAAGMATAHHLQQQGIQVQVFEKFARQGGTWIYKEYPGPPPPIPCTDPAVRDPLDNITAMYAGLHTNLPATLMQFRSLPFSNASSVFPPHAEVLKYLDQYYEVNHIHELVHFSTVVVDVRPADTEGWAITLDNGSTLHFDAVAICNGHYGMPFVPAIHGLKDFTAAFPERVTHSKNYRRPEVFAGKHVLVIGGGYSAFDIAADIATHAGSATQSIYTKLLPLTNTQQRGVKFKGTVLQITHEGIIYDDDKDNVAPLPDHIIMCTGYLYSFPFLHVDPPVITDGRRLHNIAYQCLYAPQPTLAFVGVPFKIVPFPLFEVQAKFLACCWKGYSSIEGGNRPSPDELKDEVETHKNAGREVHYMAGKQWDYQNLLAHWMKGEQTEQWRIDLRDKTEELRLKYLGHL